MITAFTLGLTAFLLCMVLTPLCRNLALKYKLLDQPDQERKLHAVPIPRIGGVPIVVSYAGALALVLLLTPANAKLHIQHTQLFWSLLPAAIIVFLTGLLDDIIGLRPLHKLLGQFAGATVAVVMGIHLTFAHSGFPGRHPVMPSEWISIPLSILWLLTCTNAVNLIDGLDGLASGVGLFAAVTTLLAAVFTGNSGLILVTMPLVGCLLAFLWFNFNPASIFLGDSGSLTIGFVLGCFSLVWGQSKGSMLSMAGPLMALALPLLDVGLAMGRRYLRSVPIFQGDRGHIHHMILARGFKPREAALILYGVCTIAASLALLHNFGRAYLNLAVIAVFLLLVWAGVNYLDYVELGAARKAISSKRMLRHVRDEIYLQELDRSFGRAQGASGCWSVVCEACADMQFDSVEMHLHGSEFTSSVLLEATAFSWRITLPLGPNGHLTLCRREPDKPPRLMMSVIERMQEDLTKKAWSLEPVSVALRPFSRDSPYRKRSSSSEPVA